MNESNEMEELLPPTEEASTEPEDLPEDPLLSEIASLRTELSELREELTRRQKADEINRRNAARSAGRAGTNAAPEYYSPDEVRAMSPAQVRENYQRIRASMQKWH